MIDISDDDVEQAANNLNNHSSRTVKQNNDLDILDRLSHKHRARAFWRQFGYNELLQVNEILNISLSLSKIEHDEIQNNNIKREELKNRIEDILKSEGYTSSDLFHGNDIQPPIRKNRKHNKPNRTHTPRKLRFMVNIFGKDFYWSGVGQTPLAFRCAYIEHDSVRDTYTLPEPVDSLPELACKKIPAEYTEHAKAILERGKHAV